MITGLSLVPTNVEPNPPPGSAADDLANGMGSTTIPNVMANLERALNVRFEALFWFNSVPRMLLSLLSSVCFHLELIWRIGVLFCIRFAMSSRLVRCLFFFFFFQASIVQAR